MSYNKDYDNAIKDIIKQVKKKKPQNKKELYRIKRVVCKKYKLKGMINDADLFKLSNLSIFSRKPTRMASGVSVIAVMTSPAKCPHGKCVFCPGGVEFMTPQSYTGEEPAARRGKMNKYDAYKQVSNRLKQYKAIGHKPNKIELIIMGGTFTSRKLSYQKKFITDCFLALNNKKKGSLKEMHKLNETAEHRCVGLTIETRPDEINESTIKRMLSYGTTRVELGVQSVYSNVLKKSKRGHTVKDSINATLLLKNSGFKINYHLMTNMPGSDIKKDYKSYNKIFSDKRFKPDMIKIYPTLLIKGTKLYELYKKGKWKPYTLKQTIKLIAKIKKNVPNYVRIMRIQRDIPSYFIEQDLKKSNLRQLVQIYMKKRKWKCNCIRCREAGRNNGNFKNAKIKITKYNASKGDEYFIEYVDNNNILFGFVRARIPNNSKTLFIRELHVYGEQVPIGGKAIIQHKGIGKLLMKKVEQIAKEMEMNKILVISGIGVRGYYKKLGYKLEKSYMSKSF